MTPSRYLLDPGHVLRRVGRAALGVGVVGVLLCTLGAWISPTQFVRSYLVAYVFWTGVALGCLAILMIHHVTGGAWGAAIRRLLESGARTLPLMALLFLPVALGVRELYEWAQPEHVAHDALLQHKSVYLNVPFFIGRAVFYFVAWIVVATLLGRWSLEQDDTADPASGRRLEQLSRGGLVLLGLTMTFASIDWMMSLEPHWFSTVYGVLFMTGSVLSAFALVIVVAATIADREPFSHVITADQFQDLGKLLLAFVMLWAYIGFSQFLIIWGANLPEEIPWYLRRLRGGWQWVALLLVAFQFALPFVMLLSRSVKRNPRRLAVVAGVLLFIRFADVFWLLTPAFHPTTVVVHWLDVVAMLAVGGVWLAVYVQQLARWPLVPRHDPSLDWEAT